MRELINQIYDTLMENVGMTKYHTKFPVELVSNQFVNSSQYFMYFMIGSKAYRLTLEETEELTD